MIAIIEFKRYVASIYIFGIIINKLSYWEELNLVILLVVNKNPEISLYYTILSLNLAVNLKIEGSKELLLDF